jgi:tetratricopeptide (TPR) repeat protein
MPPRAVAAAPATRPSSFRLAGVVTAAAAALALIVLLPDRPSAANMRRVFVPPFENRTGDAALERLGLLVGDWIRQRLIQAGDVEIATARTAGDGLAVRGAIYRTGRTVRFEVGIVSGSRQHVRWALRSVTAPAGAPEAAIHEVVARTTGAIAALRDPRFASWLPRGTATPPTFDAFKEFARGDELQLRGQLRDALPRFLHAARLDTTFTWAALEAARARMRLLDPDADSIPTALNRVRAHLTPLQLAWLDWMLATLGERRDEAHRAITRAAELAPERFLYERAASELFLHRPAAVARLLRHAGPSSPYYVDGARYWDLLADSYHQLGEHARELVVALQMRRYRPTELRGLSRVIRALAAQGRTNAVLAHLDTAVSFATVPASLAATVLARGDLHATVGLVMQRTGEELRAHGQPDAARQVLDRAITWYHGRPPEDRATVGHRVELAQALYLAGRLGDADSLYRELAKQDTLNRPVYEGSLGAIAARRGDRAEAERWIEAIERQRVAVQPPLKYLLYQQARIAALLHDPERVLGLLRGLFAAGGDFHTDIDFEGVAHHPGFREFRRPKT